MFFFRRKKKNEDGSIGTALMDRESIHGDNTKMAPKKKIIEKNILQPGWLRNWGSTKDFKI